MKTEKIQEHWIVCIKGEKDGVVETTNLFSDADTFENLLKRIGQVLLVNLHSRNVSPIQIRIASGSNGSIPSSHSPNLEK
jgi:hypothetical protein